MWFGELSELVGGVGGVISVISEDVLGRTALSDFAVWLTLVSILVFYFFWLGHTRIGTFFDWSEEINTINWIGGKYSEYK